MVSSSFIDYKDTKYITIILAMAHQTDPTPPSVTYIAIDKELVDSLQATLEANRIQLDKLMQQQTGNEPLTLKEAAAYLHVSYPTLKEYIRQAQIVPSEYGSRVWIVKSELDTFIARNRRKQTL